MPDITLTVSVDSSGAITGLEGVSSELKNFDKSASDASAGGLQGLVSGFADLKAGFDMISGSARMIYGAVDGINSMAAASVRAEAGFKAMAGSNADQWIEKMTTASKGLVDDTDLMTIATRALSTGAAKSGDDLEKLTSIGEALGLTFEGSAKAGVESLSRAVEMVGNTRGLRQLGIDTVAVKTEFEDLKRTMSDEAAWRISVFDVAGKSAEKFSNALDGSGTAWEKTKNSLNATAESLSRTALPFIDWLATGLNKAATSGSQLITILQVLQSVTPTKPIVTQGGLWDNGVNVSANLAAANRQPGGAGLLDPYSTTGDSALYNSPNMNSTSADKKKRSLGDDLDPVAEQQIFNDSILGKARQYGEIVGKLVTDGDRYARAWAITADEAERAAKAKKAMTVDQAFGVPGASAIEQQGGGALSTGISAARQAQYEQYKKQFGATKADSMIEGFDKQAQAAMDAYALSTGAATQTSLRYRDIQSDLNKQLADGKINLGTYAAEMANLAKSVRDGATGLGQLESAQIKFMASAQQVQYKGKKPTGGGKTVLGAEAALADRGQGDETGSTGLDEGQKLTAKTADETFRLASGLQKVKETYPLVAAAAEEGSTKSITALKLYQNNLDNAQKALNRLLNTSGTAVITVYSNISGGGGPRGSLQ